MPNRAERRHPAKQKQPAQTTDLNALLTNQPVAPPVILALDGCHIRILDAQLDGEPHKVIIFQHVTGSFIAKSIMPTRMAHDLGNQLLAPPGIVVPAQPDTAA